MGAFAVRSRQACVAAMLLLSLQGGALAQEFKLGLSSPPTTMDPQFYNFTPNINVAGHVFETLVKMDSYGKPVPALAESWKLLDATTWEFKLRKGVKFHDGSELTAEDVLWSLERPAGIVGSQGKFDIYTRKIAAKSAPDPYTVRLVTATPYPLLPQDLFNIFIVSKKATQKIKSEDFASGKGMIGTGPFKFVKFVRDDRVELERNDSYWGQPAAWSKVTLRFLPDDKARLAALQSGEVQAIENVPSSDVGHIREDSAFTFFSRISARLIFIYLDVARDKSPFVTDGKGAPLARNPLQDVRVRQALSMAIDRDAIKSGIMEGLSEPAGNLVPFRFTGFSPNLKPVKLDLDGAKKLLAEAGYPNGFGLTLHTPNNRYVNDQKVAQAVAQMWTKLGVVTKVEALPMSEYSHHAAKKEYSAGLLGWLAQTGEVSSPLRALLACENQKEGLGAFNDGKYCNSKVDEDLRGALGKMDEKARVALLQKAAETAVNDVGMIPLHNQVSTWAASKGISYTARSDELTNAGGFRPQ